MKVDAIVKHIRSNLPGDLDDLPKIGWSRLVRYPCDCSFYLIAEAGDETFRFFSEMVSRILSPRLLTPAFQVAALFLEHYLAAEVVLPITSQEEMDLLERRLPSFVEKVRLGLRSPYQAAAILESQRLGLEDSVAPITAELTAWIHRRPADFDYDLLTEMHHLFLSSKEEFRASRHYRHLARIIGLFYLFRRGLRFALEAFPERRYLHVKLLRLEGARRLGVVVGMSFLKENELFEERHLLRAINALISDAELSSGSTLLRVSPSDPIRSYYLEIEKSDETPFSRTEERLLREKLPSEALAHIEQRHNLLFMPQNEEEIMRDIVTLSSQINSVRDLPQVVINFNQQTDEMLEFFVIIVRVAKKREAPLVERFQKALSSVAFYFDRAKSLGPFHKRYHKEATVLRAQLNKANYLRQDQSVDLTHARRDLTGELFRTLGDFRDYNGGMIAKEGDLFERLKKLLRKTGQKNAFLLENFFYALTPPVARSLFAPEPIAHLFLKLVDAESEGFLAEQQFTYWIEETGEYVYILLQMADAGAREEILQLVESLDVPPHELATSLLHLHDHTTLALVYKNPDPQKIEHLKSGLESVLAHT